MYKTIHTTFEVKKHNYVNLSIAKKLKDLKCNIDTEYYWTLNPNINKHHIYELVSRNYIMNRDSIRSLYATGLLSSTFPAPSKYETQNW